MGLQGRALISSLHSDAGYVAGGCCRTGICQEHWLGFLGRVAGLRDKGGTGQGRAAGEGEVSASPKSGGRVTWQATRTPGYAWAVVPGLPVLLGLDL